MQLNKTQTSLLHLAERSFRQTLALTNQPRQRKTAEDLHELGLLHLVTSYAEHETSRGRKRSYCTSVWQLTQAGRERLHQEGGK